MLHELRIENLLLIERAELRFDGGLNAITGETGAGKTVLAHSLDLLMGGKARPQIVRPGASEAYVEGVFELPAGVLREPELAELAERLPDDAAELAIARRVHASGRTSAFIGGRSANVGELRALGGRLIAFFGQHEHRKLTLASAQLDILDGFIGAEHLGRREAYRASHTDVLALERELIELRERDGARERDLDLMRFELAEIEAAAPDPEEREEMNAERERLRHADGLRIAAARALDSIAGEAEQGGAGSALAAAESALGAQAGVDRSLDPLIDRTAALALEVSELASDLRSYGESIDADPGVLEATEERLHELERLERKHGGSLEAVIAHAERCRTEIERLENAEELAGELENRLLAARDERAAIAAELSEARRDAAPRLEVAVAEALAGLAMEGARLEVAIEPLADGFGAAGAESVELRISANAGMPLSPLRDAASGGELSRVMLALSELGSAGQGSTMVFDEIDAGIGGVTAAAVAERLSSLGASRQVICITHLAQVASAADQHFTIAKSSNRAAASATVERVEGEKLVGEIVRMLGGSDGDETVSEHARKLLAA